MSDRISSLLPGESAEILGYSDADGKYRRKLLAMGLTTGQKIRLKKIAPLGDPVEIETMGFSLSLRKAEAAVLNLKRLGK